MLREGDRAVACKNAKTALAGLGFARIFGDDPLLYDQKLTEAIRRFQQKTGNRNIDGNIGPGTRSLLVSKFLQNFGVSQFAELDASDSIQTPTVFLSYAQVDSERVNKLDQWLRDNGIRVIRDTRDFSPGSQLLDNICKSILSADKVIAVYTKKSKNRDWTSFEHQIAQQIESQLGAPVLVYLRLDDTPLKAHDPHRVAINAQGKTLKEIGLEIQKSLGIAPAPARFDYDENAPL